MDSIAKQTTTCDNCKNALTEGGLQADFTEEKVNAKDKKPKKEIRHFCDYECLRQYLNKKARKTSKASKKGYSIEVDMFGV